MQPNSLLQYIGIYSVASTVLLLLLLLLLVFKRCLVALRFRENVANGAKVLSNEDILLTPVSSRIGCAEKRPWQQNDVTRKGLPCTAAFACTDYKVQGRTLERVAL